jgi:hypothetical protein
MIGRFVSPDIVVQDPANPQNFNRYSYVLNNPLKYVDPTGMKFDVNYDNWTEQDYLNWFAYGATAMPVEQAYQNMMNDENLPLEEKSNLQMLHDADNVLVEFGKYSDKTIESLSNVTKIVNELPAYYSEKSMDRRYQYYGNEWYYHYGLRNGIKINANFDWKQFGCGLLATSGVVIGTGGAIMGGISFLTGAGPLLPVSAYITKSGYDIFDLAVQISSNGERNLPSIDIITSSLIFRGIGIKDVINFFR